MKCPHYNQEMKTLRIDNTEYELTQHDNGKRLDEIKIPKGYRLLKPWEAQRLWDLGFLRNNWIYVEQLNLEKKEEGHVAGFYAISDRAFLDCDRYPSNADSNLGVIFARDLEEE